MYDEDIYEVKESERDAKHSFMAWLRDRRKEKKVSLRYMGKISGIPFNYISDLENGKRHPGLATAARVARVLGYKLVFVKIKENS